jgi:hypothetical protein
VLVDGVGLAFAFLDLVAVLAHLDELFVVLLIRYTGLMDVGLASLLRLPICRPDLTEPFGDLFLGFSNGCCNLWPLLPFTVHEQYLCVLFGGEDRIWRVLSTGLRFVAAVLGLFRGFVVECCFLTGWFGVRLAVVLFAAVFGAGWRVFFVAAFGTGGLGLVTAGLLLNTGASGWANLDELCLSGL